MSSKYERLIAGNSAEKAVENWRAVPVPPEAKNDFQEVGSKTLVHLVPIFFLWIGLAVVISAWDLIVFPLNFLWLFVIGLYLRYKRHGDVYLKYQFQTFSWAFWIGSLILYVCIAIVMMILFFVCMGPYLSDLQEKWDARPSQSECDYYGAQGEVQCENQGCVVTRGECDQPNSSQFLALNSEWFTERPGVWFLGILAASIIALLEEGIKYYWMRRACLVNLPKPDHMSRVFIETVLSFGIMAGLGLGTGEAVMYTVWAIENSWIVAGAIMYHLIWKTPFHIVTGFMTACNLTRNMLMNKEYDMPWYRCILESTLFHAVYDIFTFFLYMWLLKYTSSITVILFLNFLMNGFGIFLGFRAKKVLADELINYQLTYNPDADDFEDEDFRKGGGGPEPMRMTYTNSEQPADSEEPFSGRQQFQAQPKQKQRGKQPTQSDFKRAEKLARQGSNSTISVGGGKIEH